jgi:hypothetical protein
VGVGGAILGALPGAVLGYELFGFFLARTISDLPVRFNGLGYAIIDILPGEEPALARLSRASLAAVLLGASLGAILGAIVGVAKNAHEPYPE